MRPSLEEKKFNFSESVFRVKKSGWFFVTRGGGGGGWEVVVHFLPKEWFFFFLQKREELVGGIEAQLQAGYEKMTFFSLPIRAAEPQSL